MFETLGRVMTGSNQTLKLRCGACGHTDEWTRDQAFATFGPDAAPYLVRHRLICGSCLARGRAEVWI